MHAMRCATASMTLLLLSGPSIAQGTEDRVPPAVSAFASQFESECQGKGLGKVVRSENYQIDEDLDVNADGSPDYIVYKCMFGCSKDPMAFTSRLSPCPWGNLLLSSAGGYKSVFLPGVVSQVEIGQTVKAVISNPRTLRLVGNFCKDPRPNFDPQYVYELKSDRFQRIAMCPAEGCGSLLATSKP